MTPIVYSKNNCAGCTATKRYLDSNGVEYIEKNVETDEAAMEKMLSLGFKQMPVVVTESDSWYGFDPVKLSQI